MKRLGRMLLARQYRAARVLVGTTLMLLLSPSSISRPADFGREQVLEGARAPRQRESAGLIGSQFVPVVAVPQAPSRRAAVGGSVGRRPGCPVEVRAIVLGRRGERLAVLAHGGTSRVVHVGDDWRVDGRAWTVARIRSRAVVLANGAREWVCPLWIR